MVEHAVESTKIYRRRGYESSGNNVAPYQVVHIRAQKLEPPGVGVRPVTTITVGPKKPVLSIGQDRIMRARKHCRINRKLL